MLKRFALASVLSALFAGGALAQTLSSYAECVSSSIDLSGSAEAKKLPDEQIDKVEALLDRMVDHCDANQYREATALLQDVKVMIDQQ
jgi:hypothetical protein